MAYLKNKSKQLNHALIAWNKALKARKSDITRDASIQRFEFTFELLWKTIKVYLLEIEGIDCFSPKSCFRSAKNPLNLTATEVEQLLIMTEDRNLATHIYSEKMARALFNKLPKYHLLTKKISNKIKQK